MRRMKMLFSAYYALLIRPTRAELLRMDIDRVMRIVGAPDII